MKKILATIILFSGLSFSQTLTEQLENDIDGLMTKVVEWRHHFHEYPELSNREFKTSQYIKDVLENLGLEVQSDIAYTGLVAMIRGSQPGPLIALRADIDGLPVTEELGLPFSSKERTTYQGNEVGVMHACGHDAHIAILLGVAEYLVKNTDKLKGDIMLIFQPAEEGAPEGEEGGAYLMLKEGIFDLEKPDAIFGLHVTNGPHGSIFLKPGPAMASAEAFRITVEGKQTHGSRPWAGVDPIVAAFNIGTTMQTIVSRRLNILDSQAVVSIGMVKGGTRNNIIPQKVVLEGTIRTFEKSYLDKIHEEIKTIATNVAEAHNASANVEFAVYGNYPVTFNDLDLSAQLEPSLIKASDGKYMRMSVPRTGAEDFSFFAQEVPGLYFFLGVNPENQESSYTNHSPRFYIDDDALDTGVKAFIQLVEDYSENY
ncbi:MAG: amidohydrolase [Proteobacteria bacterium]|jgi:amidohydrolase|nr:amidohydrolase [Pseudomonadota bacterium]